LSERRKELRERDVERRRNVRHGADANFALATLDAADVVPVQIGTGSQFLLGNAFLNPEFPNASADDGRQVVPHAQWFWERTRLIYTL
jgi:hypothetical protein